MLLRANALALPLGDGVVQTCVTSPPYWALRDYGTATWRGGDAACDHMESTPTRTAASIAASTLGGGKGSVHRSHVFRGNCGRCGASRVDYQLGLEATPDAYVARMVDVFREVRRVLRDDGTLWLNLGDSYVGNASADERRGLARGYRGDRLANGRGDEPAILRRKTRALRDGSHAGKHTAMAAQGPMLQPSRLPVMGFKPKDMVGIPWRVALALQADGWYLRCDIIWSKANPMPEAVTDRPTKAHEYVFLLSKSAQYFYDADAIREPVSGTAHPRGNGNSPKASKDGGRDEQDLKTSDRFGRGAGWRVKQNASFQAATPDLVNERNKRSVWSIASEPYSGAHFAVMPTALVKPCVLAGAPAGGLVLDPFMGSGTVGRVAEDCGRRWVGCDLSSDYLALARKRTAQVGLLARLG